MNRSENVVATSYTTKSQKFACDQSCANFCVMPKRVRLVPVHEADTTHQTHINANRKNIFNVQASKKKCASSTIHFSCADGVKAQPSREKSGNINVKQVVTNIFFVFFFLYFLYVSIILYDFFSLVENGKTNSLRHSEYVTERTLQKHRYIVNEKHRNAETGKKPIKKFIAPKQKKEYL